MTAEQRLLSIREQLKNVCQLGAHGSEQFTRSQAKAVLGMTMVLLAEPTVGYRKFLTEEKLQIHEKPQEKEEFQARFKVCLNDSCGNWVPVCSKCGAEMVQRKGPYGAFWSCRNYRKEGASCGHKEQAIEFWPEINSY